MYAGAFYRRCREIYVGVSGHVKHRRCERLLSHIGGLRDCRAPVFKQMLCQASRCEPPTKLRWPEHPQHASPDTVLQSGGKRGNNESCYAILQVVLFLCCQEMTLPCCSFARHVFSRLHKPKSTHGDNRATAGVAYGSMARLDRTMGDTRKATDARRAGSGQN